MKEDKAQVLNADVVATEEEYIWIKWERKYELGIPSIDKQHQNLVKLCNKLRRDLKQFSSQEGVDWHVSLANTLKELANYTQEHFATEEKLMKACHYKGYDVHCSQHRQFVEQVSKQLLTFESATLQEAFSLVDFLRDWILSHVACEDKLYVRPILEFYKNMRLQNQGASNC